MEKTDLWAPPQTVSGSISSVGPGNLYLRSAFQGIPIDAVEDPVGVGVVASISGHTGHRVTPGQRGRAGDLE